MRQLAKVVCDGVYQIAYDTLNTSPYRVYHIWRELCGEYGLKKRKKQVQRYDDYSSALSYVADIVRNSRMNREG